ncbi:hypothetical protein SSX86_016036 [Deinandra increscens subsp. villosa]|uniref:Uncharacterized protein n=1 Tax=Deinandra increscens subsp. villosa TaxID=3103831 RepID=A0AAP0CXB5_9ASTR
MYVTRSLSHYYASPEALYHPPEGPNSGYLVIQDEDSETYSCFGRFKNGYLARLPFPQNKRLTTRYLTSYGQYQYVDSNEVVFIPVLNQPLSSNRYYAVNPHGPHKGEAFASSKEEDMGKCCFSSYVLDVQPRPLDPHDLYQQFEIVPYFTPCKNYSGFYMKSLADDGYPPQFLSRKGWKIHTKTPTNYELSEAKGIDDSLRTRLPDLNFPPSTKMSNHVVVGKWYCPFVFIKEGTLGDQVKKSVFYEMTLEQSEAVFVGESRNEAKWDERKAVDGVIWFTCLEGDNEKKESVGLNLAIVERMRWEEEKVGWVGGGEKMIERMERFQGIGGWKKYGCYVLVERYVLAAQVIIKDQHRSETRRGMRFQRSNCKAHLTTDVEDVAKLNLGIDFGTSAARYAIIDEEWVMHSEGKRD